MIGVFEENPVLLLFVVAGIGYWIGSVRIKGAALGVAAVLFTGIIFGALDPGLRIPDIIIFLGLSIFVYTIGLQSGPGFFDNLKKNGFRDILFVISMLLFSALITIGLHFLFDFEASSTAGLFAGVTTNTPALAGLLDVINNTTSGDLASGMSNDAVVGYSLTYPMGILGVLFAISIMAKWMKVDYKKEQRDLRHEYVMEQSIGNKTVRIVGKTFEGMTLRDLVRKMNWPIIFGRILRNGQVKLATWDTKLSEGDLLKIVGSEDDLKEVVNILGSEDMDDQVIADPTYETKRLFVSNPRVAGQKIASLNLSENYSAIVTRVRRGDVDILASGETIIELGDQVRFIARKSDVPELSRLFGNSYEALSHVNLLSFGLGMGLGLLLGQLTFALPGGTDFKLGFAGGPLIVALILGTLRRTGPIVWTLSYSSNLTLRQIGLILLLAGIGINSGFTFKETVMGGGGGLLFISSVVISVLTAVTTLLIGYKVLKIPFSFLTGMVSNQPAILDFSLEKAGNKLPNIGFTSMLPVALITKILFVQLLFTLLN